jgi:regulator of protease activity HflC (stomatin/prohibitin superfamily)
MERNIQKIGFWNFILLLLAAGITTAIARYTNSLTDEVSVVFLWQGLLVAAFGWFQMRMEARERLEKLELEELARSAARSALFESTEAEVFPARRAREQFERWVVPSFTILLFGLQCGATWWLWTHVLKTTPEANPEHLVTMASLFALFAFILFLLGKYSTGVARLEGQRLLRPGGSYMLLGAYLCVAAVASIIAVNRGYLKVDFYLARALCAILTLSAAESLINLILEIYRPRVKGAPARLTYESRLIGLLGQPEGLVTTAAQALDYQFGFKVSETWFYRFMEKALAWLILLQLGALMLSTCFVFIEQHEQGLLERFGQPVEGRAVLGPGPHLKLPWPIDQVYRYPTRRIQTFNIGYTPDPEKEKEKVVVWTVAHTKEEFNLMVASRDTGATNAPGAQTVPVNLLTVSIPVQYRIKDVRAWATNSADAANLLERISLREVVLYLVGADLFEVMSSGAGTASEALRQRIQAKADEYQLGAEIVFVGIKDIHPPVSVAESYENVIGAQHDKEAKILTAMGASAKTNALAQGEAARIRLEADAFRLRRTSVALAQAAQFTNQLAAFAAAPDVYPQRVYLNTFARAAAGARKYVIATTNAQQVLQINLEDKIRSDILEMPPPPPKK